jgi:hypothetical protein
VQALLYDAQVQATDVVPESRTESCWAVNRREGFKYFPSKSEAPLSVIPSAVREKGHCPTSSSSRSIPL